MLLTLSPAANEAEFSDPALCGEWVSELPKMLAAPQTPPWCSYVARHEAQVVGLGGFKGPPSANGEVEIGYLTLLPQEGRGVAKAIAARLFSIAVEEGASGVVAHTLPEENASTRVLMAGGFTRIAVVEDPEDGTVWRWFRPARPSA
jgi:RimJ/RimL family protein N-acetyltransferase